MSRVAQLPKQPGALGLTRTSVFMGGCLPSSALRRFFFGKGGMVIWSGVVCSSRILCGSEVGQRSCRVRGTGRERMWLLGDMEEFAWTEENREVFMSF
jgi:hypothetical protein